MTVNAGYLHKTVDAVIVSLAVPDSGFLMLSCIKIFKAGFLKSLASYLIRLCTESVSHRIGLVADVKAVKILNEGFLRLKVIGDKSLFARLILLLRVILRHIKNGLVLHLAAEGGEHIS